MTSRAFEVKIVGDVRDAKRALQSMDANVSKFGQSMTGVAKLMAGAFAVKQVFDFGSAAVKRAEDMQSAYAATAKIIENTGGAAGLTADEVKKMNRQLAFQTGIDKALVTEGSNILLTFKGIRNELGEGNAVFDRANMLALDMSKVFGQDVKSAATQLGKALEDPIKGVGALARVGVTFTKQQKDQIKALQESGDLLGAQQIVLDALEGQVGGVAVETADATAIISAGWAEVQEKLGNVLLPVLAAVATYVTETLLPAFSMFTEWVTEKWNAVTAMFQGGSSDQVNTFVEWAKEVFAIVKDFVEMVTAIVERFVQWGTAIWENYGGSIKKVFAGVAGAVKANVDLVLGILKNLIAFIKAVFTGEWGAAWDAVKGMVGAFVDWFTTIPGKLLDILMGAVGFVGNAAADLGKAIINGIIGFWNKLDLQITLGPLPTWMPGIGGKQWTSPDMIPDLPKFAKGGLFTTPTAGIIAEAGTEAVIPLSQAGSMGLGNTYNITVQTGVGDEVAIGEHIVDLITAYERSSGQGWQTAAATGF
ncbi:MAG: hypothetical protein DWP92_01645 [Armatimonadetes bacterium]|nr:MAG: hypothetical protein DWP92_01645 [Armatimonadota bacterium]